MIRCVVIDPLMNVYRTSSFSEAFSGGDSESLGKREWGAQAACLRASPGDGRRKVSDWSIAQEGVRAWPSFLSRDCI